MMKNIYYVSAIAGLLLATSCSSDDVQPVHQDGNVSFEIMLPAAATRADIADSFGSGLKATQLQYMVFLAGSETPLQVNAAGETVGTATFVDLHTTVTLNLPKGKKYDIIFWAQNPDCDVFTLASNGEVSVDYSKMTTYTENNDAFCYALKEFSVVAGQSNTSVTLYRPFAQLNIGTSDLEQAENMALDVSKTKISVTGVYSRYDLRGGNDGLGEVAGDEISVDFPYAPRPADQTFPYPQTADGQLDPESPYAYLTMNWLLVPSTKTTASVTLDVLDQEYANPIYYNVPLQRNHRTNLFGKMLTAPAEFNVVIDRLFDDPDYNQGE